MLEEKQIKFVKEIGYPTSFIDMCFKSFLLSV